MERTPTIAFTIDGISSADVAKELTRQGIFASHGDFYAMTVVERLGQAEDGVVRAGCACYTTSEEGQRLAEGVKALASRWQILCLHERTTDCLLSHRRKKSGERKCASQLHGKLIVHQRNENGAVFLCLTFALCAIFVPLMNA